LFVLATSVAQPLIQPLEELAMPVLHGAIAGLSHPLPYV
jgi:hypothetical protein